jgi:hypothetical protein
LPAWRPLAGLRDAWSRDLTNTASGLDKRL